VIGAAVAAIALAAAPAYAGPTYPTKTGDSYVDNCDNHVGGGTAGGHYYPDFQANEFSGAGCSASWVKLLYIDNSGYERVLYTASHGHYGMSNHIFLNKNSYRRVLEVYGAAYSVRGHETQIVYLFF
jgi:hypothetical protein